MDDARNGAVRSYSESPLVPRLVPPKADLIEKSSTSDQGTPLCRREITQLSGTKGSLRDNHR
jgi:hypothetical protein